MGLAMAKESILFNDENRDVQLAIVVILGLILLFMYPLAAVCGAMQSLSVYVYEVR
jgi:uncharacterized membrane protein YadS